MQEPLVVCDNLIKIYKQANVEVVALQGLNLEIAAGEMLAIVGASGSGKSTLMNIIGGLDAPTAGRVQVAGYNLERLNEQQRTHYRNQVTGYVWQQSGRNLLADLSVAENVNLPQVFRGVSSARQKAQTRELLEMVGLGHMAHKQPIQLSGGEQQRVAIAVALANRPALLLADEPTGSLDSVTTQEILNFLRQINRNLGMTILIVTHDVVVAAQVDRTIAIRDGRTSTETVQRTGPASSDQEASAVIGLPGTTHEEAIFIDHVGLLQLPANVVELSGLRGRVVAHITRDHVELWPPETGQHISHDLEATGGSAVIGISLQSHQEMILVDRVGRLQLPSEALARLSFHGRALIRLTRSHVELWPQTHPSSPHMQPDSPLSRN